MAGRGSLPLVYSEEVRAALAQHKAVVALESTIISHGMPYPQNLSTAQQVEAVVRHNGATPATIAILSGRIHIGLDANQLEALAKAGTSCAKVSRRDIALVCAQQRDGATTVAATMLLAHAAGIRVFVTGGIGGVHRGAEASFDISADLTELGRTPMAVVCAGAKSVLDIPKTLECLETQGVAVVGYQTDEFPAFFTRTSGCRAHCRVDSAQQLACMALQLPAICSGMLVAVPIPEEHAADGAAVQSAIEQALQEASEQRIAGPSTTPFLLQRVQQLTGGASLKANIQLVLNNAKVGAQIAVALAECMQQGSQRAKL